MEEAKEWHIWDFPDDIYLSLKDNTKEEFFKYMFKKFNGKRPYAKFLGLSQKTIKSYHIGYTYKKGIKHPQSIPISLFKKSLPLINKKLKKKIENNIIALKCKNRGIPIINPKLPLKESPKLYRVVAHMIGDGSAPKRKVPYYANSCKELREQFKEDLKIFGEVKIYERETKTVPIVCFPKVITDILSYILSIKFSNPNRIPNQIFHAPDEYKSAFLQALFDDEGTISTNLAFYMSNQNIVKEIRKLTGSLYIKTGGILKRKNREWKDNFIFTIKRKSLTNFKEKIGFFHPKKTENLNFAINTQNRKQRTRSMEEIKKQILNTLENKPLRTIEIANNIQLTLGHTLRYMKKLEQQNKVIRSGFKSKIIWNLTKDASTSLPNMNSLPRHPQPQLTNSS